ncbi:hypothetical protein ACMT1E_09400 [Sphingomonas flavalba]|uniref:hypothetical protein n=1 Tax=Sphingomonas flavalba TaxID=2559804 RepID=UPI0039E1EC71
MIEVGLTRRATMRCLALSGALVLAPGARAAVAVADRRAATTAALLRTTYPHRALTDAFYRGVADRYLQEIAANAEAVKAHDLGLAALDGSYIAPFAELPAVIQRSLVEKVDQLPFFKALQWRGAEMIYRDPAVWKLVGYEGSSIEYGGYLERGFDDIDWLPKTAAGGQG